MNSALQNLAGPGKPLSVFQTLPHTLGAGAEVWRVLDKCHQQRNIAEYEGELDVSERLVLDLIQACDAVRIAWEQLDNPGASAPR